MNVPQLTISGIQTGLREKQFSATELAHEALAFARHGLSSGGG